MKQKTTWIGVLLMVLSFVLILSVLTGCVDDEEFSALKEQLEETIKKADDNATKIEEIADTAETKVTVAELRALVEEIKLTADAAATAAQLEQVIANLAAVKDTADAAATAEALAKAKAEIEALIAANGDADANVVNALAAAQSRIDSLEAAAATKKELTDQIEALKTTLQGDLDDKEDTLRDLIDEIKSTVDGNSTDIGKINTSIETIQTALESKEDSADVEKAIDELENTIAGTYATQEDLADAIGECKSYADGLKKAVDAAIDDLTTKYNALSARLGDVEGDIEDLQKELETIKGDLTELQENDFASAYQAATEELLNGTYSLAAFEEKVATVSADNYAEADYAAYTKKVEELRFFLNRALSVSQIEGYFQDLQNAIDAMPTLSESLDNVMTGIETNKTVTADAACLEELNKIYRQIQNNEVVLDSGLQTRYDTIVAAQENLARAVEAAEEVVEAIADIKLPIVYQDSEAAVKAVEESFATYETTYFAQEAYTALYADAVTAAAQVSNYETLRGYRARLTKLTDAAANKVDVNAIALNFAETKPLWDQLDTLTANKGEIDIWIDTYRIDPENMAKIYGTDYVALETAIAYATAMNTIYTDSEVVTLVANLEALCGKEMVLYTDLEEAQDYRSQLDALKAAISAVTNFDAASDANYATMIGDALGDFAEVEGRLSELVQAKEEIDAIVAEMTKLVDTEMTELVYKVTFSDYNTIVGWKTAIDEVCTTYSIAADDANYVAIVADAVALYEDLYAAYQHLTEDVARIYLMVREDMGTYAWALANGNEIIRLQNEFNKIVSELGVDNLDLELTLSFDDGTTEDTNLSVLYVDWNRCVTTFTQRAVAAQTDAVAVSDAINGLTGLTLTDVKNYATIAAAWDVFAEWAETHLGVDVNNTDAAKVLEAIAAIQDIKNLREVTYVFVSVEEYTTVADAYVTATANFKAAATTWADVKADMDALNEAWQNQHDIHADFASVEAAYNEYVANFYAGSISAETELDGEYTLHETFAANKAVHDAEVERARVDAQEIKYQIAALVDPEFDNAQAMIDATAAIRALIDAYYENYGCEILTCDICGVTPEEALRLAKVEARAEYAKAYADAWAELSDDDQKFAVETAFDQANTTLDSCNTDASVENAKNAALSGLRILLESFASESASEEAP